MDIDLLIRTDDVEAIFNAVGSIGYTLEGGTIPVGFDETHPSTIHRISKAVGRELTTLGLITVNPTLEPV